MDRNTICPIDTNAIVQETEKAFALQAYLTCVTTDETIKRLAWFPKSQMENEGVPRWLIDDRYTRLRNEQNRPVEIKIEGVRSLLLLERDAVINQMNNRITGNGVIDLDGAEKDVYTGAGWMLARFVDARLVALFDPLDFVGTDDLEHDAKVTAAEALKFADEPGDYVTTMCSSYQLCEVTPFDPKNVADVARLTRLIFEACRENSSAY